MAAPAQTVEVGRNRHATVYFPLVASSSIEGRVFIDGNQDGFFQETEEPLEQIAVILNPGEQFRRTNADGAFRFEQLLSGPYTVTMHREDLPKGYEPASEEHVALQLAPGQHASGVNFATKLRLPPK